MWIKCKNKQPSKSGYYYCYYYNIDKKEFYYKSIYWSFGQGWQNWNRSIKLFHVLGYIEDSRQDYYGQCLDWVSKNIQNGLDNTPLLR